MTQAPSQNLESHGARQGGNFLFVACFVALVATSFAFIIRAMLLNAWQVEFLLSETQKGEIAAAGLWPFGISIVLFSLIIDRVGYGKSLIFAFVCHVSSAVLMFSAKGASSAQGYWMLYIGSILNGLAAGTVEAGINPPKAKVKMLSILHAGWPGGLALGGVMMMLMGETVAWNVKIAIVLIPVALYGLMLLKCKFPPNERVVAGVPYRDMLKEAGALGCLIAVAMVAMELGRVFDADPQLTGGIIAVVTLAYLAYARSLGRPMYIFLLLVMVLLAITELGVDSWITDLMGPAMEKEIKINSGWLIVWTSTIMMILRFCIGPIVKVLKPLGVLLVCAILAATGLFFLSQVTAGLAILAFATIYAAGKSFFWPVTLGVVSERFPRGGALTLNAMGGVGMLAAGIIGTNLLGYLQDTRIDKKLKAEAPALRAEVISDKTNKNVFTIFGGEYHPMKIDVKNRIFDQIALHDVVAKPAGDKAHEVLVLTVMEHLKPAEPEKSESDFLVKKALYDAKLSAWTKANETHVGRVLYLDANGMIVDEAAYKALTEKKTTIDRITGEAKQTALSVIALLPAIMAVCYLLLILYFKATGGYKAVELSGGTSPGGH
ncbi:MAG: MFS transporter [Planctomycetota bacterium]|nr:MFS transporter [Planctomycetota bacterium]